MQQNRTSGLEIGPETMVPLWEGERMDDGMAVEGSLWLEQSQAAGRMGESSRIDAWVSISARGHFPPPITIADRLHPCAISGQNGTVGGAWRPWQ